MGGHSMCSGQNYHGEYSQEEMRSRAYAGITCTLLAWIIVADQQLGEITIRIFVVVERFACVGG